MTGKDGYSISDTTMENKQGDQVATLNFALELSTGETAMVQVSEKGNSQPYAKKKDILNDYNNIIYWHDCQNGVEGLGIYR